MANNLIDFSPVNDDTLGKELDSTHDEDDVGDDEETNVNEKEDVADEKEDVEENEGEPRPRAVLMLTVLLLNANHAWCRMRMACSVHPCIVCMHRVDLHTSNTFAREQIVNTPACLFPAFCLQEMVTASGSTA